MRVVPVTHEKAKQIGSTQQNRYQLACAKHETKLRQCPCAQVQLCAQTLSVHCGLDPCVLGSQWFTSFTHAADTFLYALLYVVDQSSECDKSQVFN